MSNPSAPPGSIRAARVYPALLWWSLACLTLFLPRVIGASPGDATKMFDIPAGDAAVSLRTFSMQSGAQVIFPEDAIEGSRTKALKGAFTPMEAIRRLLSGTDLKAAQDRESGSFAVTRASVRRKETSRPNG